VTRSRSTPAPAPMPGMMSEALTKMTDGLAFVRGDALDAMRYGTAVEGVLLMQVLELLTPVERLVAQVREARAAEGRAK